MLERARHVQVCAVVGVLAVGKDHREGARVALLAMHAYARIAAHHGAARAAPAHELRLPPLHRLDTVAKHAGKVEPRYAVVPRHRRMGLRRVAC
jgi:hypothetical protein